MTSKTAIKLKKAGFPQLKDCTIFQGMWILDEIEGPVFKPTLEYLIESCKGIRFHLMHDETLTSGLWFAYNDKITAKDETMEGAVAKLWLELQK